MKPLALFAFAAGALAACLPVTGDRIAGRDLALADPRFAALPATLTIGFAPAPGAQRVFTAAELGRLAHANGINLADPRELCFALPMHRLNDAEAAEAMRRSLPPGAELGIVELAALEVPAGELAFPHAALEPPVNGIQLWRGYVRYSETKKIPVWARVRVSAHLMAVIAAKDLAANVPIDAASLRMEARDGPVERRQTAMRIEDVAGRIPKQSIKAGSAIPLDTLATAPAIRRGDSVNVEVRSGRARLLFIAIAESEGREGEIVALRNPISGRTFHARMEGSKAVIVIGEGEQL